MAVAISHLEACFCSQKYRAERARRPPGFSLERCLLPLTFKNAPLRVNNGESLRYNIIKSITYAGQTPSLGTLCGSDPSLGKVIYPSPSQLPLKGKVRNAHCEVTFIMAPSPSGGRRSRRARGESGYRAGPAIHGWHGLRRSSLRLNSTLPGPDVAPYALAISRRNRRGPSRPCAGERFSSGRSLIANVAVLWRSVRAYIRCASYFRPDLNLLSDEIGKFLGAICRHVHRKAVQTFLYVGAPEDR
jgi:hypothetical protein